MSRADGNYTRVVPGFITRPQGGGPQPVLSDEDVARMVHMHDHMNRTVKEIAAQFHVHPTTVGRYLRGAGREVKQRHPASRAVDPDSLLQTCQLAEMGYSVRDIAVLQELHPTTVRWRLRRYARNDDWRWRRHRVQDDGALPRGV